MNIQEIAQNLGGSNSGSGWSCRCPAHDDKNPSLSLNEGRNGKILVKCHAGCTQEQVIDALQLSGLWPDSVKPPTSVPRNSVQRIWNACTSLQERTDTPVHLYLAQRGLNTAMLPISIAFHPSLPFYERNQQCGSYPALIAAITNPAGALVGLQRIYLTDMGAKADVPTVKKAMGTVKGGAVRFGEPSEILCVAEGIETALAVMQATGLIVWSTVSAMGMIAVVVPDHVKIVRIWCDHDVSGTGYDAATDLAAGMVEKGIEVYIHQPLIKMPDGAKGNDWLDILNLLGVQAFRESLDRTPMWSPPVPDLICLQDVEEEHVTFLAYPWLPRGKVTMLVGDPGIGKSWIVLALASAVSRGHGLFGQTEGMAPGNVLVLNTEDGLADTIKVRLSKLGADHSRIFAPTKPITFDIDGIRKIERIIQVKNPVLVTIDPIQAHLGGGVDSNSANQVRAKLMPLVEIAGRFGCAVLVVGHLNKDGSKKAIHRLIGSVDFVALARSVVLVASDPDDAENRAIFHIKSNLAAPATPIGYAVAEDKFSWTGPSDLTQERVNGTSTGNARIARESDKTCLGDATKFLRATLESGPLWAVEVIKTAKDQGISYATLKRAKDDIGVRSIKRKGASQWDWFLSEPASNQTGQGAQPSATKKLEYVELLDNVGLGLREEENQHVQDTHVPGPWAIDDLPLGQPLDLWEGKQ